MQALQVGAFEAVALSAEQLEVVHRGGTAQSHRDDVVVLKVELATALGTPAAISFEHGPADLAGDGLALPLRPRLPALIDVEHHVRPVQALRLPALPVPDQGQHIPLGIAAGLPVKGIFEPPPDTGAGPGDGHGVLPLDGREVTVVSAIDTRWRTAGPNDPDRLRNKKPRSRRKRALESWRSCGLPDVAALRANGGITGGLATTSDRAANGTKPTAQIMITSPNAAIGPSPRRRFRGTWWPGPARLPLASASF